MLLDRCQMALRKVLSGLEINDILHDLEDVSKKIKTLVADLEEQWGVEISNVQIKDISFEETMRRAMAVKAEADRNAKAKIFLRQSCIRKQPRCMLKIQSHFGCVNISCGIVYLKIQQAQSMSSHPIYWTIP